MKTILIALVPICFLLGEVFSEDKYTTKYDNVDIDVVLNTERLLNAYVNCLLDQGPCTPDAAELKSKQEIFFKSNHNKLITLEDKSSKSLNLLN